MEKQILSPAELKDMKGFVREKFPKVQFMEPVLEPVGWGVGMRNKVEGRWAMTMMDPVTKAQNFAAFCTDDYQVVHHEVALFKLMQALDKFPEFEKPEYQVNMYNDGGRMFVSANFPGAKAMGSGLVGEDIIPRVILKNSYDLSLQWEYAFGGYVLRCTNGMRAFEALTSAKNRHVYSLDVDEHIGKIGKGLEAMSTQFGIWGKWAKLHLEKSQSENILMMAPFSDKQKDNLKVLPEMGTKRTLQVAWDKKQDVSGWFMASLMTQYVTHELEDTFSRQVMEEKVNSYLHKAFNGDLPKPPSN
jgi:hypothetical protein